MYEDRVLADPRNPSLQHNLYEPVILLIRRCGSLRQRKSRNNSLRIACENGFVKLLKFVIRARYIAITMIGKIGKVRLMRYMSESAICRFADSLGRQALLECPFGSCQIL